MLLHVFGQHGPTALPEARPQSTGLYRVTTRFLYHSQLDCIVLLHVSGLTLSVALLRDFTMAIMSSDFQDYCTPEVSLLTQEASFSISINQVLCY